MPRLTLYKRPLKRGFSYTLAVEFSAPKLLFGNNFSELTDQDFKPLLAALATKLYELTGRRFAKQRLASAAISVWHPSKNIILDPTACQTVFSAIAKLDVSRMYDVQRTDFRDGHALHIHCNSVDLVFYDKLSDLRKAKVSGKRAIEKDSLVQLGLLEAIKRPAFEVLRYELRLVGKASIKRTYPNFEAWTFEDLFKARLCRDALLRRWQKLTASVDLLALDVKQPYELLQNYLKENPKATPQAAMAATAGLLVANQAGIAALRSTLDAHYGVQAWYRIKPLLQSPQGHRFKHFQQIENVLKEFAPISANALKNIANN